MSSDESTPRLTMRGIRKTYGPTIALANVDLTVRKGEVMALVGENGAGKSTLMKTLSGAHDPDSGEMTLNGKAYKPKSPLEARDQGIAMIYQELSLAPHLSAMENIMLGIEPHRFGLIDWDTVRNTAKRALEEVGIGDLPPETPVNQLSIARQQLVEIARAVALKCDVLVLDEPTSSLTKSDIEKLFALIRKLRAEGISIIYISHFFEELEAIADRFTVLRDGSTVGTGEMKNATVESIISLMVGREIDELYTRSKKQSGETLLKVNELAGPEKPVSASFELKAGEVFGIAGLVGSGRTELFRTIFGLDKIRSGQITVETFSGAGTPAKRWSQGMGLVSEDRKTEGLALGLSIADNITLSSLKGLGPGRLVTPTKQNEASKPWIDKIPIKCQSPAQKVSGLSGGNQQKVAIARLLHSNCDILLLDEPTRGIDVGSKAQVYKLIDELAQGDPEKGIKPKAILMISSYLPELLGTCDRIAVMCRGTLSEARPNEDWDEHKLIAVATGQEFPE